MPVDITSDQLRIAQLLDDRDRLRTALVGLIGVDTREELEAIETALRLIPQPLADRATSIDAVHALLATLPEGA